MDAYPLQWPRMRPRKIPANRKRASFGKSAHNGRYMTKSELSIADATARLKRELRAIQVDDYVLSSDVQLRRDGLPRSGLRDPDDPGVALYFTLEGKSHCMPCDTYDRVADNIAAIAKHIEASRAQERYGVATMADMFTGFAALPAPGADRPWWDVLGVPAKSTATEINRAYRSKAMKIHRGEDATPLIELNTARDTALREATDG